MMSTSDDPQNLGKNHVYNVNVPQQIAAGDDDAHSQSDKASASMREGGLRGQHLQQVLHLLLRVSAVREESMLYI